MLALFSWNMVSLTLEHANANARCQACHYGLERRRRRSDWKWLKEKSYHSAISIPLPWVYPLYSFSIHKFHVRARWCVSMCSCLPCVCCCWDWYWQQWAQDSHSGPGLRRRGSSQMMPGAHSVMAAHSRLRYYKHRQYIMQLCVCMYMHCAIQYQ